MIPDIEIKQKKKMWNGQLLKCSSYMYCNIDTVVVAELAQYDSGSTTCPRTPVLVLYVQYMYV